MDLDTIEGLSTLDHSKQKGRSELAHKGSLGHRRPPTRAGIRALVSSVWDQDNADHISEEPPIRDADQPTETEEEDVSSNAGWKHPPKHAVLVFPMQLLNKVRTQTPSPDSSPASPIVQFEEEDQHHINEEKDENQKRSNRTTTVKIRPASEEDSDILEDDMNTRNLSKRHSGPTIVSITLKDPLSRTSSLDETNNARNSILHGPDSDLESLSGESMVITIGDVSPRSSPLCQDTGTQMYGTLRASKKKKERPASPVARNLEGPTQILIRPFNRNDVMREEDELSTDPDRRSSKSSERCSSLVYIKSPSTPVGRPHSFDGGGWRRTEDEDSKENFEGGFRRIRERSSLSSLNSRDSSKDHSPDRSRDSTLRHSLRDPHRVHIQTWDRRVQPTPTSPSPSRIRELVLQPATQRVTSPASMTSPAFMTSSVPARPASVTSSAPARPASIIGDGGETERYQLLRENLGPSSRMSSPTGDRYRPLQFVSPVLGSRAVLGQRENKPEWLAKIDLQKRRDIDWDNLGRHRLSTSPKSPDYSRLDRSCESLIESRNFSKFSSDRFSDRSTESLPCLTTVHSNRMTGSLLEETAEEVEMSRTPSPPPLPVKEPEWVRIAQSRRKNSLIDWDSVAGLRPEPDRPGRRGSLDDALDSSHNVGVQVNIRRHHHSKDNSTRERRTASVERTSRIPGRTESSPTQKGRSSPTLRSRMDSSPTLRSRTESSPTQRGRTEASLTRRSNEAPRETAMHNMLNRVTHESRATEKHGTVEKPSRRLESPAGQVSRRGRSISPPARRWTKDKEVVIEELPKLEEVTRQRSFKSRDYQHRPTSKVEPVDQSRHKPRNSRSLSVLHATDTTRPTRSSERREPAPWHHRLSNPVFSRLSQELTVDVGPYSDSEDGDDHNSGSKKKVRFMINSEDGLQKKIVSITPTTYTMFGMDNQARGKRCKNGSPPEPEIREKRASKPEPEPSGDEDYELQAYKIINQIKQMTKEKAPEPGPKGFREPSPVRPPSGRCSRESSPEHDSHRRKSSSVERGSQKRRSQPRSASSAPRSGHLIRDASPASSSDSAQPDSDQQAGQATRKTPDWMKKALHKQKSAVDWDNLVSKKQNGDESQRDEKCSATDANKPMWAKVKLKKTPYSTKFLSEVNGLTNGKDEYESEDSQQHWSEQEQGKCPDDPHRKQELVTVQEVKQNNREIKTTNVIIKDLNTLEKLKNFESGTGVEYSNTHVTNITTNDNTSLPCLINDSEGYSSMESSLSARPHRLQSTNSPASCVHCGRSQSEWSPLPSSESSPLSSVETEDQTDDKLNKPVIVDIISKQDNCQDCPTTEKSLRMVTVHVIDRTDSPNLSVSPVTNGFNSDEDNVSKGQLLETDSKEQQPQRPNGNYVILEGCDEKVGDDDTKEGVQDGCDKEPIWKNVRHLCKLRGVSGNQQAESKNGSVTRTVQQTKDGRHILTTTFMHPDKVPEDIVRQVTHIHSI